jgi:hypothetical protein
MKLVRRVLYLLVGFALLALPLAGETAALESLKVEIRSYGECRIK